MILESKIVQFSDEFCCSNNSRVDQCNATDVIVMHAQMGSSHTHERLILNKIIQFHNKVRLVLCKRRIAHVLNKWN